MVYRLRSLVDAAVAGTILNQKLYGYLKLNLVMDMTLSMYSAPSIFAGTCDWETKELLERIIKTASFIESERNHFYCKIILKEKVSQIYKTSFVCSINYFNLT